MSVEPYVSSAQAAKMLNVSLRTIQLWVEKGVLTAWKTPGGHRRIAVSSVEKLQQEQAIQAGVASDKLKIVVVEDEPGLRKLYRRYFDMWDLPVELHLAEDGFRGLIRIGEVHPDLLLTDLMMPGMDGFQMIKAIHTTEELNGLDIVVITGMDEESIKAKGMPDRGVRIVYKPVAFEEIKTIVEEKLSLQGLAPEGRASQTNDGVNHLS
jgi:excisionase family DNA binding protein